MAKLLLKRSSFVIVHGCSSAVSRRRKSPGQGMQGSLHLGAHGSAFLAHSSSKLFSADRRSCTHTLRNVHFLCHGLPRDQRVVTPAVHTAARGYPPAHIGPNSAPPRCSARAPPRQSHGVEALLLRFGTLLVSHVGVHATRHFFRCLPVRPSRVPRRARLPSDRICFGMRSRSFGSVRSPSCWKVTSFPAASTSSSWAFRSFCAWPSCISMVCRFSVTAVSSHYVTHTFSATTPKLFTVSLTPLSRSIKVFCEYPRAPLDALAAPPLVLTMLQLGTLDHLLGVPALDASSLRLALKCICWSCSCFRCGWTSRHGVLTGSQSNQSGKPTVAGRALTASARH
mmetsp:Transcript_5260/g.15677  ORF Transcript_5260/g.15677 Transcript_5260/m.15677 type:complete len:340 (-) Transcript_5260:325-1344(-)